MLFFFFFIIALTFHKCQFVKKAFLFIFIFWPFLKWGLFGVFFFDSGCCAPCCSFFRRAFCVRFCLCFLFFSGIFGFLFGSGCWAPRSSFFRRAFDVRFCLCFLFFSGFFGFLATTGRGEGQRLMTADWGLITAAGEAHDSGREAHYWGGKGL